jgi:C4-dicarboxylate-specific signal transduction histidine kinase
MLLPLIAAVVWSAQRTRSERQQEVRDEAGAVAHTAAAHLDQYFTGLDAAASALARHPALVELDPVRCGPLFADLRQTLPLLANLVLADPAGVIRCSSEPSAAPESAAWAADVARTMRPAVIGVVAAATRRPGVILAYPVPADQGGAAGVLALNVDLSQLRTAFGRIPLPQGSVVTLRDTTGRILARSVDEDKYIGSAAYASPTPSAPPPTEERAGVDGVDRFYGNAMVERGPWVLSVGIPRSVVAGRLAPLWRRNLAIAVGGVIGVLLVSLWTSSQMTKHLNLLRSATQRIAAGDLTPLVREPVPNRELADLQDAFIGMAANLREARDALDHRMEQERKMNETLHSLERQVVRQERLAAVGVLVSGVAHELNNPLQAILGTAELLEREHGLNSKALEELAFLKTQSGRAREIIRNLSRFSSQQSGAPAFVDLRAVVAEVVQLRRRDLDSADITLDVEATSRRRVYANFTELEQVTLNFVINAQQAIEAAVRQKGRIAIHVFDAGRKVRLEVLDNGPGVKPEDEPKLFQPFFTTKPVGKGTGLGLSVSYGIIDSYGGAIGYRGNDWGGATFFFELPAHDVSDVNDGASDDRPSVLQRSV